MSKRLTDTEKYKDSWFVDLETVEKLLFYYLIDNVDNAGFYEISFRHIEFHLGINKDEILGAIKGLNRGLLWLSEDFKNGDVIFLKNFIKHQLKSKSSITLNPYNNYHSHIIDLLKNRTDFLGKFSFFDSIIISGIKKNKEGKILEKTHKYLNNNLAPKKGLRERVSERERESERERAFGKSENLLDLEVNFEEVEEIPNFETFLNQNDKFLNEVCEYFSQTTEGLKMKVYNFFVAKIKSGNYDEFKKQTEAYMVYKTKSNEIIHKWQNYVTEWENEDWINKKPVQKNKQETKTLVSNRG